MDSAKDPVALLEYLRGSLSAANTASTVITDSCTNKDLPKFLHELCTKFLIDGSWQTRKNAAELLLKVVSKFSDDLGCLLSQEVSPGEPILRLSDLNVEKMLTSNAELYSSDESNLNCTEMYSDSWIRKQRAELTKRLKIESNSIDVKTCIKHIDIDNVIDDNDFIVAAEKSSITSDFSELADLKRQFSTEKVTGRNWFVAIVQLLTVGLLSPNWEVRHGCSMGVSKIMTIFLKMRSETPIDPLLTSMRIIASNYCEDIVCFGIYALSLDRFIDCSTGATSVAPVKEAIAQMVTLAFLILPNCSLDSDGLVRIAFQLFTYPQEWMVQHAGLLLLKYYIPILSTSRTTGLSFVLNNIENVTSCIHQAIRSRIDEIYTGGCQVMQALGLAICKDYAKNTSKDIISHVLPSLSNLMDDLVATVMNWDELSSNTKYAHAACVSCCQVYYLSQEPNLIADCVCKLFIAMRQSVLGGYTLKRALSCQLELYRSMALSLVDITFIFKNGTLTRETIKICRKDRIDVVAISGIELLSAMLLFSTWGTSFNSESSLEPSGERYDKTILLLSPYSAEHDMCKDIKRCAISIFSIVSAMQELFNVPADEKRQFILSFFNATLDHDVLQHQAIIEDNVEALLELNHKKRRISHKEKKLCSDASRGTELLAAKNVFVRLFALAVPDEDAKDILKRIKKNGNNFDIIVNIRRALFPSLVIEDIGFCNTFLFIFKALLNFYYDQASAAGLVGTLSVAVEGDPLLQSFRAVLTTAAYEANECIRDKMSQDAIDSNSASGMLSSPILMKRPLIILINGKDVGIKTLSDNSNGHPAMIMAKRLYMLMFGIMRGGSGPTLIKNSLILAKDTLLLYSSENSESSNDAPDKVLLGLLGSVITTLDDSAASVSADSALIHVLIKEACKLHHRVTSERVTSEQTTLSTLLVQLYYMIVYSIADLLSMFPLVDNTSACNLMWKPFMDTLLEDDGFTSQVAEDIALMLYEDRMLLEIETSNISTDWRIPFLASIHQCIYASSISSKVLSHDVSFLKIADAVLSSVNSKSLTGSVSEEDCSREVVEKIIMAACESLLHGTRRSAAITTSADLAFNGSDVLYEYLYQKLLAKMGQNASFDLFDGNDMNDAERQMMLNEILGACGNLMERFCSCLSRFQYTSCRDILLRYYSYFILEKKTTSPVPLLGSGHDPNEIVKILLLLLPVILRNFDANIVGDSSSWMQIVLEGTNRSDKIIRKSSMLSLSILVPYLSLTEHVTQGSHMKNTVNETILELETIFESNADGENSFSSSTLGSNSSIPSPLAAQKPKLHTLRHYQKEGVKWITDLWRYGFGGGILADEMGLGKTAQALTAVTIRRSECEKTNCRPSLVICPASLIQHWINESQQWGYKNQSMNGISLEVFRNMKSAFTGATLVVISFNEARQHAPYLSTIEFEVIIVDEAHCIRNPNTAVAKAIFSLNGHRRLALTGTPVQNKVDDLWSIMTFLMPDFLGDYPCFRKTVVLPVKRYFKAMDLLQDGVLSGVSSRQDAPNYSQIEKSAVGLQALHQLHQHVLYFILRRKKQVVATDLPDKTIIDIMCPLSKIQRDLYNSFQQKNRISDEELEHLLSSQLNGGDTRYDALQLASSHKPLQVLEYLKLLSVHPCLSINRAEHPQYYSKLINDNTCSGKLHMLCDVLIESGVIPVEEILRYHRHIQCIPSLYDKEIRNAEKVDASMPSSCYARTSANRPVKVSSSGKRLPVHREKRLSAKVEDSDSSSSSSSSSSEGESKGRASSNKKPPTSANKGQINPYGKKCLIFAQHRNVLDVIETTILKRHFPFVPYARLDGSVPPSERFNVANQFNRDIGDLSPLDAETQELPTTRILLMTTRSCGLGLNLSAADTVIFVENDWNPFVDLQAMDRAHRIGQKRPLTVFRLIAESTIEARIMNLQSRKSLIATTILTDANATVPCSVGTAAASLAMNKTLEAVSRMNKDQSVSRVTDLAVQDDTLGDTNYECYDILKFMDQFDL